MRFMVSWKDLWRPELAGKISMVDPARELIGAVLKIWCHFKNRSGYFFIAHYLIGVGDVWVGCSDVLPAAKHMSNIAVVVPMSGPSLWADIWAIPAASKFASERIGGR
ncbi:hypothetical protein MKW98_025907, partial [Papaver atlanticum]